MDAAFAGRNRGVCRTTQPADPRGKALVGINVIIGMQTCAVLVDAAAPFVSGRKPGIVQAGGRRDQFRHANRPYRASERPAPGTSQQDSSCGVTPRSLKVRPRFSLVLPV